MTAPETRHLSEETLILHYYGEADDRAAVEHHLGDCAGCRDEWMRLGRVLALVDAEDVPEPPASFERDVWVRLAPHVTTRKPPLIARLFPASPRSIYAGGLAALLLAAFVAGRVSRGTPVEAPAAAVTAGNVSDRVLVVAVVDHLDRSQMMLVELLNADLSGSGLDLGAEQSRARELVAENRLYQVSAVQAGDDAVSDVLADLERVLIEIANTPHDTTAATLEMLRQRIEARGLLFRVRVVHSEMRERERRTVVAGSTS